MSRAAASLVFSAVSWLVIWAAGDARAGGMLLPVRGVRTVERAGALIAGADDGDALWLDPAGLAHLAGDGKTQLLFDIAYVAQSVDYTRIDGRGEPLAPVSNQQPGQVIPTIAATLGIGDRLVIAGGIAEPYAGLHRYAESGPQRYASVSLDAPAFVYVTFGAGYQVSDRLRVGATVVDVVSKVASRIVVSGCPGQMACAAEDPEFDTLVQDTQTDYFAPSGSIGVQYDAGTFATLGLAIQGPSQVSATGNFTLRLPSTSLFSSARVVGDASELTFTLPAAVRAGVEIHPTPALRVEAALDTELWSMHDEIDIKPHDVRIEGAGAASRGVGNLVIPRKYKTSFAPAIGVEWHGHRLMLGAGYAYESAAAPPGYVSVLTVDSAKHVFGIGGGYEADGWQIGGSAGFAWLGDISVSPANAGVPQLTPIRDQPGMVSVNAGSYKSHYLMAGLRFARWF